MGPERLVFEKPEARLLRSRSEEVQALQEDLLITITCFFRDLQSFEALQGRGLPDLFKRQGPTESVRVWVPACATGEEAYSLAIHLLEEAGHADVSPGLQLFATDMASDAIAHGREGRYPESTEADISEERLDRFLRRRAGTTACLLASERWLCLPTMTC